MLYRYKFLIMLSAAITLVAFLSGVVIDRIFKSYAYFSLDMQVNIMDLLNLFVTIFIAVVIPVSIIKFIDDTKAIKLLLIDELKELLGTTNKIRTVISDSLRAGLFTAENRREILYIFHEAEMKIGSIKQQTRVNFKNKLADIDKLFKIDFLGFKNYLTGGEMMHTSFNLITEHYYKESNTQYLKLENSIKKIIQKTYRY